MLSILYDVIDIKFNQSILNISIITLNKCAIALTFAPIRHS